MIKTMLLLHKIF